ncbi:MAG: PilZ domain-containing protein [Phycisphaerae bacterium]
MMNFTQYEPQLDDVSAARDMLNRFLEDAPGHGFATKDRRQQGQRIYHGCWPILVSYSSNGSSHEMGASLYNISAHGLAFTCMQSFAVGEKVWVKLVQADDNRPRISCTIRHSSEHADGFMMGGEIIMSDR